MADDAEWTLHEAPQPLEEGWSLHPAEEAAAQPRAEPSTAAAIGHGLGQGATLGFGDEINGAIQALGDKITGRSPGATLRELYRRNRDMFRSEDAAAKAAHPVAYGGSEALASLPTSFLPGLNVARGAGLAGTAGRTALAGALGGLGASDAKTATGDAESALAGAGVGGALGAAGHVLGRVGQKAFGRSTDIADAVAQKARELANSETLSARSAAGTAAQDAYKQLEHLRELGAMRSLTKEEAQVAAGLEAELAGKAQGKLLPAAARKAETAEAYKEAVATEADRAQELADRKLSGGEALAQLKARALRYGLPAVGGALAGAAGFGGHGALVGAGSGALMGAGLRPMMHSLVRMGGQPAVATRALNLAGNTAGILAPAATRTAAVDAMESAPELAAKLEALRRPKEPEWTLEPAP